MLKKRLNKWYGWRPDTPDFRDHPFKPKVMRLPGKVDLRTHMPAVYDQGNLGSCTANAIAGAVEYTRIRQKLTDFMPSRLFIYYQERVIEGTVSEDAGAEIRDGIKAVHKMGVPDEKLWPYVIARFTKKPSQVAYKNAKDDVVSSYQRIDQDIYSLRAALAQSLPVVFGFSVYSEFESDAVAKTGELPMPKPSEKELGGHAVLAVGYNDKTKRFLVRNSWGKSWGKKGYYTMPYAYLANSDLASDFWTINKVD